MFNIKLPGLKPIEEYNIPLAEGIIKEKNKKLSNSLSPDLTKELQGGVTALFSLLGNTIGGGKTTDAGVGNLLGSLGNIASVIPGWGTALSAGLNLAGGLYNGAFGYEKNEEAIAGLDSKLNSANSRVFNASNTNDLINQGNFSLIDSVNSGDLGEDGWLSDKIQNLEKDYNNKVQLSNNQTLSGYSAAAENLDRRNDRNMLANYTAYGGPLTMRYTGLMSPFGNRFDLGGNMPHSNGGVFSNGLMEINEGGTHEQNPYEGVPMGVDPQGVPNLVEEGETIFDDYVFSNRLKVPKAVRNKYKLRGNKEMTFAEASKKLAKESEERPNDPISQRGLESSMADLAMEQEKLRKRNPQHQVNKFDTGGPFNSYGYVRDYNGGWYGVDGEYTQEYLDRVNALTAEQLQAQFDDQYSFYSNDANKGSDRWKAIDAFYKANPKYKKSGYKITADDVAKAKKLGQDNKPGYMHYLVNNATLSSPQTTAALNRYYLRTPKKGGGYELTEIEAPYSGVNAKTGMTWAEANPNLVAAYNGAGTVRDAVDVDGVSTTYTDYYFDTKPTETPAEKVDLTPAEYRHRWEGLRYAPVVGLSMATLTDALGLTNKPDYSNAGAVIDAGRAAMTPQQVTWSPLGDYIAYNPFDRNYYSNQLAASSGATRRNILNTSGGNRGQALAGLLAADYNAGIQLGNLARQAEEYNLAQRHQVSTFNRGTNQANSEGALKAAMANQDAAMKARGLGLETQLKGYQMKEAARLTSDKAKADNLSGFIDSLGAIGMDNAALNARDFTLASGTWGPVNPGYEYILTGRKQKKQNSYGGKLNRGRKRLTY